MTATTERGAPAGATSPRGPGSPSASLAGTGRLILLALRRDRIVLTVWLVALLGLLVASVASIVALYGSEEARTQYAVVAATNVVARAFDGPMAGTSLGAIVMTEVFGFLALLIGIMSVQAVVRHTRLEEETGRAELVGAAVVGRDARLVAALVVVVGADLLLGALTAVTLVAAGLPLQGSVLAGAALALVGVSFAAVAAVAVQVAGTARGANAIGISAVGATFLLRAVGDAFGEVAASGVEVMSAWPSWLSPIGWGQQLKPFHDDRAWVLVLPVLLAVVLTIVAFVLTRHRDVGTGMLPPRPGPATASRRLRSPLGLAWRLHRGALLGWSIGVAVLATAFGAIVDEVEELLATSDELAAILGETAGGEQIVDLYVAFVMVLAGYVAAAYLVQAVLRVRSEEQAGRVEPVLATAVGRTRYLGAHVLWAGVGAVTLLAVVGMVGALATGLVTGTWGSRAAGWPQAAVVQLPAVAVLGGVAVAATGWLPRRGAAVAWAALLGSLVVGMFGGLLELPEAVMELDPFGHLPAVPAEPLEVLPLVVLLGLAALLAAVGFVGWRRRDVMT